HFNFDQGVARQLSHCYRRTRWRRRLEEATVNLVHGGKIRDVLEKYGGLDRVIKVSAGSGEHGREVLEDALRLRRDVARHQLSCGRIKCDLSGAENKFARLDGL